MSRVHFYLLCLGAALVVAAIVSALLVQHVRARELRQLGAIQLLRALDGYGLWVAAQCRGALFQGQGAAVDADPVLEEISTLQDRYFPAAWRDVQQLFAVHARLMQCLLRQHSLWLRDPERWIETSPDGAFLALWREHRRAARSMEQRLAPLARSHDPAQHTISPA